MSNISALIDTINQKIGSVASWSTLVLVILICCDVLFRYIFQSTQVWIIELEWHLFSVIFLLGSAYALKEDKHVRVDVFYNSYSKKKKAIINLIGTLFFLFPWTIIVIKTGMKYANNSLYTNEGSPNPGGLPARYIIKYAIAFGFFLLLLQGISILIKNINIIRQKG